MAMINELPILRDEEGCVRRCPSAQPDMEDVRVLGVVQRKSDQRQVAYVDEAVRVTAELLHALDGVEPTQVLRFSAKCEVAKCMHFDGSRCQLATRVVRLLPEVVDKLPACTIRPTCRWYLQEGPAACVRCPQVVTFNQNASESLTRVAYGPREDSSDWSRT
jgi:hypothetical protein